MQNMPCPCSLHLMEGRNVFKIQESPPILKENLQIFNRQNEQEKKGGVGVEESVLVSVSHTI